MKNRRRHEQKLYPSANAVASSVATALSDITNPLANGTAMVIHYPLVSSHFHGGIVKSVAMAVTDHGASIVDTSRMPRNLTTLRTIRRAPYVAAAQRAVLQKMGLHQTQRIAAEAFVKRARLGDQNAMGMIAEVKKAAKKNPMARAALGFMKQYIQANPVNQQTAAKTLFGNEMAKPCPCVQPYGSHAVLFANGPMLTNEKVSRAAASFGQESETFLEGIQKWQSKHDKEHEKIAHTLSDLQREILKIGRTIGMARGIQAVRMPQSPISVYSERAAWELGE